MSGGFADTGPDAGTGAGASAGVPVDEGGGDGAFYVPLGGERFSASELTQGPWSLEQQHGGPPSALLAGRMERLAPRPELVPARITVEFLGPVPVGEVRVGVRVVRDGRSVQLVAGELSVDGRVCLSAQLWRVRAAKVPGLPAGALAPAAVPAGVPAEPQGPLARRFGYGRALDWRFVSGSFRYPGPAVAWVRCPRALVAGEEPRPLERVVLVADTGSGIGAELDSRRFVWPNLDLSIHLLRTPVAEWLCLDSAMELGDAGVGVARTRLFDEAGLFGSVAQSLFVAPVPGAED
ncbi:thioesterase family protein [Yinghuangia seranimata]|uniref:thioesterase family protein n=1 Tax=Yinghuangia seranimata TaxID=408067 RepID=UPI00248B96B5|nr:thioesterase family protein [Yinghuangia seranimata]MDI2129165.1 thioesterase family protein [Yinghuangia seranimata]